MPRKFNLAIRLPENDFPIPIRFVSADVVILAEDLYDASSFGHRLLAEWNLSGIFEITATELPEAGVHAQSCGLQGSGLDKTCICHVDGRYRLACGCYSPDPRELVAGTVLQCVTHGWVPVRGTV